MDLFRELDIPYVSIVEEPDDDRFCYMLIGKIDFILKLQ